MEGPREERVVLLEDVPEPSRPLRLETHLAAKAVRYDFLSRSIDGVQIVHQGCEVRRRVLPNENRPVNWSCSDGISTQRLPLSSKPTACDKRQSVQWRLDSTHNRYNRKASNKPDTHQYSFQTSCK